MKDKEIVLPTGRFASLSPLRAGDLILSQKFKDEIRAIALLSFCLTIDERNLSVEEILLLQIDEFIPIWDMFESTFNEINKFKQGVK